MTYLNALHLKGINIPYITPLSTVLFTIVLEFNQLCRLSKRRAVNCFMTSARDTKEIWAQTSVSKSIGKFPRIPITYLRSILNGTYCMTYGYMVSTYLLHPLVRILTNFVFVDFIIPISAADPAKKDRFNIRPDADLNIGLEIKLRKKNWKELYESCRLSSGTFRYGHWFGRYIGRVIFPLPRA